MNNNTLIVLKCSRGMLGVERKEEDRIIKCITGYNYCSKSENQGTFDTNCFTVEEKVNNHVQHSL